jgi:hypothetical protein
MAAFVHRTLPGDILWIGGSRKSERKELGQRYFE